MQLYLPIVLICAAANEIVIKYETLINTCVDSFYSHSGSRIDSSMMDEFDDAALLCSANDVVNALGNTCKRIVAGAGGEMMPLNLENGVTHKELNDDIDDCRERMDEVEKLPYAFTARFRKDMLDDIYKSTVQPIQQHPPCETFARSLLPGLLTLRSKLERMIAEARLIQPTPQALDSFFDDHKCMSPLCLRSLYKLPVQLPVSHPAWFYYPPEYESMEYLVKAVKYITAFLKKPFSNQCALCDLYFTLAAEDRGPAMNLAGLPEEFRFNRNICLMYGGWSSDNISQAQLSFKPTTSSDHVTIRYCVEYRGVVYI